MQTKRVKGATKRRLTSLNGTPASCLGLAAGPHQDPRCVKRAFASGINYYFFYGPGSTDFIAEVSALLQRQREDVLVATGSGSRRLEGLRASRRKLARLLGVETIDVFFFEYVHAGDDTDLLFGKNGILDELRQWREEGHVRFVGATTHDRGLAKRLAADARVDVLMHRFNMAHRKAALEVFPTAAKAGTPVVAFTATRWGTLLGTQVDWPREPPTAADCYRYCLAQPPVQLVLTAPRTLAELGQNLAVLESSRMGKRECGQWEGFGDLVYGQGKTKFETS